MALTQFPTTRSTYPEDQPKRLIHVRADVAIEEEIWYLIRKDRSLGPKYDENLIIEVDSGRVRLRGHILESWHSPLLVNIANRVDGVVLVKNELVADTILRDMVVQALLENDLTSPYVFTVKCRFGWVRMGGLVPTQEIAKSAEGVAGSVPALRGVLTLPAVLESTRLPAGIPEPVRLTLQPRLASTVFQDSERSTPEIAGLVSEVMVDPCSRLVSAIGVRVQAASSEDGRGSSGWFRSQPSKQRTQEGFG